MTAPSQTIWLAAVGLGGLATMQFLSMSRSQLFAPIYVARRYLRIAAWAVIIASSACAIALLLVPALDQYATACVIGCAAAALLVRIDVTARHVMLLGRREP